MKKKIIAKIAAIITAFVVMIATPMAAFAADTGGGLGGGGSNITLTGPIHWKSIAYDTSGKAYDEFMNKSGWDKNTVESQIRGRVGDLNVCKKSKVIWYINHNAQNKWVFNYSYTGTHGSGWDKHRNGSGTIENPHVKLGNRAPSSAEISNFKTWDRTKNGNKIDKKPGYTIICSGAFMPEDKPPLIITKATVVDKETESKDSETFNHPYTYTTEVKPQAIQGKIDPIGEQNLHAQKGTSVKTNYGKLWDRINSGSLKLSPSQLKSEVTAAVNKDKARSHAAVNLDAANKAGMAEGGVLNVYEQTQYALVQSKQVTDTTKISECTYHTIWNDKEQRYNAPVLQGCKPIKETPKSNITMTAKVGTAKNTGFWQMISVHCNPEDFQALMDATDGAEITSGSKELTNGNISASAVTKRYDKAPTVDALDFGSESNPNAAKKKSGMLGFYDKECGFECTPDSLSSNAQQNGAKNNVEDSGNVQSGNRTGATTSYNSGSVNSNSLEFFRDNAKNKVDVDLWYPKRGGAVVYDGEEPLTTTVSRWSEGTPGITNSNGGQFTMTSAKGDKLFTGKDAATNQRNWNTSLFSNSQSTMLTGKHTSFNMSSTWASDADRPQVLNIKYEYAPQVQSTIYTNNIGFGANSSRSTGSTSTVATAIDGKCYVNYKNKGDKSEAQFNTVKSFHDNTGTGTENKIDGAIVQGAGSVSTSKDKQTNLVVNFVRATTE